MNLGMDKFLSDTNTVFYLEHDTNTNTDNYPDPDTFEKTNIRIKGLLYVFQLGI
jgi:hypothetical protein